MVFKWTDGNRDQQEKLFKKKKELPDGTRTDYDKKMLFVWRRVWNKKIMLKKWKIWEPPLDLQRKQNCQRSLRLRGKLKPLAQLNVS